MIQNDAAIISKVSYTDMIEARDKWEEEHPNDPPYKSPYFGIPNLRKIGLSLTKECLDILQKNGNTTSMKTLFTLDGNHFKYEHAIKNLMKAIFGDGTDATLSFLKNKDIEGDKVCNHTIVVMPMIKMCDAMKDLLEDMFGNKAERRTVISLTGNADVTSPKELNQKLEALDERGKKSIILTKKEADRFS